MLLAYLSKHAMGCCRWLEVEKQQHRSSEWIPPRVKELQRQVVRDKHADLLRICECVDRSNRSVFHYVSAKT